MPAVKVTVRVRPGSRRDDVGGRYGAGDPPVLLVRVAAPAVDGRANDRLVHLLAAAFDVPTRAVTIVGGAVHRTKVVEIEGMDPGILEALLAR